MVYPPISAGNVVPPVRAEAKTIAAVKSVTAWGSSVLSIVVAIEPQTKLPVIEGAPSNPAHTVAPPASVILEPERTA